MRNHKYSVREKTLVAILVVGALFISVQMFFDAFVVIPRLSVPVDKHIPRSVKTVEALRPSCLHSSEHRFAIPGNCTVMVYSS